MSPEPDEAVLAANPYATRRALDEIPRYELPQDGMPPEAAYQLIADELNLDGNPALNLASFVTTWMEPEARRLIEENLERNSIDHDEYPQTTEIEERVVSMLARLFHAPKEGGAVGTRTAGSSEAIMLAGLAMKWRWRARREAAGLPADRPNLVMGADVHVVWEKLCRYFEIEPRIAPMTEGSMTLTAEDVASRIDERTIGVAAVLGTTYTGQVDDLARIDALLGELRRERGLEVALHVDAATGGFIAPFSEPDWEWDFRLPSVRSINVSGHKYGLVYPGVGWLVFRHESDLPEELIFHCDYLGSVMPTYTLNFSIGGAMVLAQYFNLIRLGRAGYTRVMDNTIANARRLAAGLADGGLFAPVDAEPRLPVVAFALRGDQSFTEFDVAAAVREHGWIVPAYALPADLQDRRLLRVVVKENFSRDMADKLLADLADAHDRLAHGAAARSRKPARATRAAPIC